MTFNIWRAPTDNDMYLRKQWSAWGYDCAEPRTYGTTCEIKDGCAVIACEVALLPVYRQRAATIHAVYTIDAKGAVSAKLDVERKENAMTLPRFGVRLMMPRAFGKARYLGYGPAKATATAAAAPTARSLRRRWARWSPPTSSRRRPAAIGAATGRSCPAHAA